MVEAETHLMGSQGGEPTGEFQSSTLTLRFYIVSREHEKSQFWELVQIKKISLSPCSSLQGTLWCTQEPGSIIR